METKMDPKTLDQKTFKLSGELLSFAKQRMQEAVSERDLAKYIEAYQHAWLALDRTNFEVNFLTEGFENTTLDDYVKGEFTEESRKSAEKDVRLLREMHALLTGTAAKELYRAVKEAYPNDKFVLAALKRKRDNRTRQWSYRGLAIFPENTFLYTNPLNNEAVTAENPGIVFLVPGSPCVEHACDLIYKDFRRAEAAAMAPLRYIGPRHIHSAIGATGGVLEFMNSATRQTKDRSTYVLAAFMGAFSNQKAYRIPPVFLEVDEKGKEK
jgi:hypothetical protein